MKKTLSSLFERREEIYERLEVIDPNTDEAVNLSGESDEISGEIDGFKSEYGNTGTTSYFDGEDHYNNFGQQLRDPSEYDPNSEGYTPFGDE